MVWCAADPRTGRRFTVEGARSGGLWYGCGWRDVARTSVRWQHEAPFGTLRMRAKRSVTNSATQSPRRRGAATIGTVRAALLGATCLVVSSVPALAQKAYYQGRAERNETVIVDFSVLDKLGDPPNLPGMLRPAEPRSGSEGAAPQAARPQAARPQAARPQPATPQASAPRPASPQPASPQPASPQRTAPQPAAPQPASPQIAQPAPSGSNATASATTDASGGLEAPPSGAPRSTLNVAPSTSGTAGQRTAAATPPDAPDAEPERPSAPPPKPVIADEPEPAPTPEQDAAAKPAPQPEPAPAPEPEAAPEPEPKPEPPPEPQETAAAPEPDAASEPAADPEPAPAESETGMTSAPPPAPEIDAPADAGTNDAGTSDGGAAEAPAAPVPEIEEPAAAPSETAEADAAESGGTQLAAVDPSVVVERPEGVSVLFEPGTQDLPAGAEAALDAVAEQMKQDEDLRLRLRGYALADGDTANQSRRVSLFRALAVRTYLMKRDVSSRRMDVQALGSNLPGDGGSENRVDVLIQR